MNNLLVIDGSAILSTHFFASLPKEILAEKDINKANQMCREKLHYVNGQCVESVGSFIQSCLRLINNYKANYAVVVFDKNSETTFRKQQYPAYKANRSKKPDALKEQMTLLHTLLPHIGIQCFWADAFEADDLGGSIIRRFAPEFDTVYFVTKDHDWLQLIGGNVKGIMLYTKEEDAIKWRNCFASNPGTPENNSFDTSTPNCYGKQVCFDEYVCSVIEGVDPKQIPMKKGLAGDSSDNIPGVKGVGPKAAVALSLLCGDVKTLYEYIATNGIDKLKRDFKGVIRINGNALIAGQNDAILSEDLATIKTDIAIPYNAMKLKYQLNMTTLYQIADFYGLTQELRFYIMDIPYEA